MSGENETSIGTEESENVSEQQENPDTGQTQENKALDLLKQVAERKDSSGPIVVEKLVTLLVDREIDDRVRLLESGLEKRKTVEKEIKAIKPDTVLYDAQGKKTQESFTEPTMKKLKEAKEKLARIDKAINLAIEKNDFQKLKELK